MNDGNPPDDSPRSAMPSGPATLWKIVFWLLAIPTAIVVAIKLMLNA